MDNTQPTSVIMQESAEKTSHLKSAVKKFSNKCVVCAANSVSHPDRKFHRFPKDSERSQQWRASLNIPALAGLSTHALNTSKRVCGDHFVPADFKTNLMHALHSGTHLEEHI